MALIKCLECGKEISDTAVKCPHCGAPIKGQSYKVVIPKKFKIPLWTIATFVIGLVLAILGFILVRQGAKVTESAWFFQNTSRAETGIWLGAILAVVGGVLLLVTLIYWVYYFFVALEKEKHSQTQIGK